MKQTNIIIYSLLVVAYTGIIIMFFMLGYPIYLELPLYQKGVILPIIGGGLTMYGAGLFFIAILALEESDKGE